MGSMKKYFIFIIFTVGLMFFFSLISLTSADFDLGNMSYSIIDRYSPGSYIEGWMNISITNEPVNSLFETNKGDSISVLDLLNLNSGSAYTCFPLDCNVDYTTSNRNRLKTFNLDEGESKLIGFKFNENLKEVVSVNFTIESDAQASCSNQIKVDFFNDGIIDAGNNNILETICPGSKTYGCYGFRDTSRTGEITSTPYCQRITLPEAPGFKVGAWVKEEIESQTNIKIDLYDSNGDYQDAYCDLSWGLVSILGGEVSCDLDYTVEEAGDYYLCVSYDGSGVYRIMADPIRSDGCGFFGFPSSSGITEETAYRIFAEAKKFDDVRSVSMEDPIIFGILVEDYLLEKYGDLDCSVNECIVPIKIISENDDQEITISNLKAKYDTSTISGNEEEFFYDLTEIPARITAGYQVLSLDDANFSISDSAGNYTFSLSLGGNNIFTEDIVIEKMIKIKGLTPIRTAAAVPTTFEVVVENPNELLETEVENASIEIDDGIVNYNWDFGNGGKKKTAKNSITYTYNTVGTFNLTINVTDSSGDVSSKTFKVTVETPINAVKESLDKKINDLNNVKKEIESYPPFYQNSLNSVLGINDIDNEIKRIQTKKDSATSDQDYIDIMLDLLALKVPESIVTTKSGDSITFFPKAENIKLEVLEDVGGGDYKASDKNRYIDSIFFWNQKNLETKITFKEVSVVYESGVENGLNFFGLDIKEKEVMEEDVFIILKDLENLNFEKNYGEKRTSGYVYIPFEGGRKTVTFSTTEEINFADLPAFISPSISDLVLEEEIDFAEDEEKTSKWVYFSLIMFFLFIVWIIVYVIIQEWYKRKYENYLFKNRNNLYNLVIYIDNSKKKGLKEGEIKSKLRKAGWSSEQIRYVMRKYHGKRTGMLEIPIIKALSVFRRKSVKQNKNFPPRQIPEGFNSDKYFKRKFP